MPEEFPLVDELEEEEAKELFPGPEDILAKQRLALTETGAKIQEVESQIIAVSERMETAQRTMSTIGGFFVGLKEMIFAPGEYTPPGALARLSTERNVLIDELELLSDQQVRNLWGMSLYEALPMKIQQGEITSFDDLLAHPAFRLPDMTEMDRAAARQAYDAITGAIGRAGVAEKPDATQQDIIKAMAEQYRPQVPLAGVHQLSVEELVRGFQARYVAAPPALSLAEVNAVYREAGMPEELIQEAQDLAKMSSDYDDYWAEVLSSQELTRAGLEDARMPEMSLKDQLLLAIESPGLLALDAFGSLARHWIWPWASTTFRARIFLGQAISRPLDKYEQNFMALYEEARATDDWWHAGGKAWEEAELGWGNRLIYEWVLDPLNLIGFGVYTKVAGKIPWAGKWLGPLSGKLEFGWVRAWDRMIFDPIKRAVHRIPKTPMQAARSVAGEDFKNVIRYISVASGGKYYTQVPLDDVAKLLIKARNFALKHPEDLGPMGKAGRAMLRQPAITESGIQDMLTKVGVTLDVPISRDMLTNVNLILSEVSGHTTGRLLTLKTAPPLLLRALTAHETAESLKAAKGILTALYRGVIGNSNKIIRKSNSVARLLSNIYDNTQTIAFKSSESLAAHNLEMTGKLMSIGSNIKWTTMNIWRTQIDKWAVTPFARMYLVFAAYGPFNALEGYMKPVFARVNPFWKKGVDPIRRVQVKWAGTLKPLDIETAVPYIQISPEIPSALGIERSSAALIKWRRFWSAYNVGDWMVDRWGRLGAQQRSNYWDKLATRYLAEEEAPDLMRALATRIDDFTRGMSDDMLKSLRLTRGELNNELLDRAMSGPAGVRGMIDDAVATRIAKTGVSKNTALGDNIAAGHVQELAANYTLVPDAIQENAARRAGDGRLWARAGAGIDDFYNDARLLMYDNYLTSPELFQSRYSKLAKDLIDTVPTNKPEFLEKLKYLDDMVNFYSESSSKVIRGARELADEMHIYAGDYESLLAKQQYYDNVWNGLKGYMDSADDTFAKTVDNMKLNMEVVKLPADQRESVLKLFDMWTDQVRLTKATRLAQRSAEETLLAATPPGRARDAIFWQKFREAQAKPWRDWELSMAGLKEKTFIQQDMASRILGNAGPPPPMVDAAGRQLTKMDVATIFQSHPRSMSQATMHMENMTIKGKPQFIAEVRARAEIMAKAAGRSADDLGFTRANIEAVYDQAIGDMLIDPARASILEPQLMELQALRGELWNVYDTKGLPRGTVEAMNEKLSGLADDLGKVPGYMAPPPKVPPAVRVALPAGITDNTVIENLVSKKLWRTFGIDTKGFAGKRLSILGDTGIDDLIGNLNTERIVAMADDVSKIDNVIVKLQQYKAARFAPPPKVPPVKVAPQLSDDFLASRQRAADRASQEYFKDWADYTNETALTALGRTIYPFWVYECVPEYATIMTKSGWKHHSKLSIGEDILAVDPETLVTRWEPLEHISVFDYDENLMVIPAKGRDIEFTPNHRWLVINKHNSHKPTIKRGYELSDQYDLIPRALPHSFPSDGILTEREAAILGWACTDGYIAKSSYRKPRLLIYQHIRKYVADIEEATGTKAYSRSLANDRDNMVIYVHQADSDKILSICPDWSYLPETVSKLSEESAESMWDAMMKAEGNTFTAYNGSEFSSFVQNSGPVKEAFELLSILLGKAITSKENRNRAGVVNLLNNTKPYQAKEVRRLTTRHYKGKVWCPVTASGVWVMNCNGSIVPTGNTHRLFWVPRNMIRFPGMFKAWGSYMSNSEDGYWHIPGTSLQANPLRGTIWMGGAIRLIRQDYPEYYDMVPGVSETLDYLSRFGFYPAAYLNTLKAVSGMRSARGRPMWGELLPATIKTPLNAYLALHGDSKPAQNLTQILVPDIYREYIVMIFASRLCQERGLDFSGRHIWDKVKQGLALTDEEQQLWGEATKKYGLYGVLMEQGGIFRIRTEQQVEAWEEAGKLIEEATGITEEQQLWIRRHGYRVSDYAMVDPATQDLLRELDSIKYWSGIFTVLFPSSWQEEDRRRGLFWSSIRDLDDARLSDYEESERRVRAGEISFRQWNRRNSQVASKFRSDFDAIATSEEYRNIPIGLFDELDDEGNVTRKGLATVMEERGQLPPVQHPADEILNMYYSIELEEAFDSVSEAWYMDWDSYFWKIDSIVTAVGEDRRPDLVSQITKNMSELRRLYWQVSREYFRPYNRVQTVQLELYDETQKAQIRRFLVTPSDAERDVLREILTPAGTKLISGYQAEVRQARVNMRLLNPPLDAWLLFFQITQKTLSTEAQGLYTQYRRQYGIAP